MASEAWQEDADAPQLGARARSELDRCSAVEKVIAAMHERIDRPFSLDEMARIAYLSRFYFNRVFREATGLPPVRFHTALRIAAAKRLLLTTGLSVTEVCLEVGYQSLGTFTTHFHELVGLSPRELRRSSAETAAAAMARFASGHDATGAPAVEGEILGAGEGREVFVGLFAQQYPQGLPAAYTTVTGSAPYQLRTPADGTYYVTAAAFADDGAPLLVAVTHQPVRLAPGRSSRRDLWLRPMRRTDPPILPALPRAGDACGRQFQGMVGHQPIPKAAGTLITQ
jgi:AraC family transcriptional regulator